MVSRPVDRFAITMIAGAGLCAAAMTLSPGAAAVPLKTGGYHCDVQNAAGAVPAPAAGGAGAGAAAAAAVPAPCDAVDAVSLSAMPAGVPVLPGPPPVVVPPVVPPLAPPLVPPVVPPLAPPLVPPVVPPLAPPLAPPLVPPVPLGAGAAAAPAVVPALDAAAIANANGIVAGKEAVAGPPPAGVGPSGGVPTQPGPQRAMAH